MHQDKAESIAIRALSFVAADAQLMPRFLALSGIEVTQIRNAARSPGFLAGVLRFIVAHEPTLTAFSQDTGIAPAEVAEAARALPFGSDDWDTQP